MPTRLLNSPERLVLTWFQQGGTLWVQTVDGTDEAVLRLASTTRPIPIDLFDTMLERRLLKPKRVMGGATEYELTVLGWERARVG